MTKLTRKLISIILVVALILSLSACGSDFDEPTANPTPEMEIPEGDMPFGDMEMPTVEATETPEATTTPGDGTDVVVKDTISDANGVYLYTYESQYTSTASNYVIIRMDDEELLSKDLYIMGIDISYSGDSDFDVDTLIPDLGDGIQINSSKMKTYWKVDYDITESHIEDYSFVEYLVALARDDDGDYYKVEYNATGGYWQEYDSNDKLDDNEELYIGLPLTDSGSYETDITFEIKDSEDSYQFGYYEKEIEDGIEFELTGSSKISKAKADVYVMVQITEYDDSVGASAVAVDSEYIQIDITDYPIEDYIRVEVDGEEDDVALLQLTNLIDIDDVYAYIYIEESIDNEAGENEDIYLAFMEETGFSKSVDEDNHIEEGDLNWVNYEFTIYEGTWYVFDDSNYYKTTGGSDGSNSNVGTAVDYIYSIGYSNNDFVSGSANEDNIDMAISQYEKLSESEQAYLLSLTETDMKLLSFYSSDDETSFETWYGEDDYNGYNLIDYLEAAEDYLDELEIVSAFETVLDNYDLWDEKNPASFTWGDYSSSYTYVTNVVTFNSGSTTMVDNLETVLLYLDELSDDDRAVIEKRSANTYNYLMYCESLIVADDVEYVMAEISAVVASYLVADLTNTLLYVDLDDDGSVIDLDATHMIYSTSLFASIERTLSSFEDLAPEKQELLEEWTLEVTNGTESISSYENYYYFNSSLILLANNSGTYSYDTAYSNQTSFQITYADAIYALAEMAEVTQNLNTIFSYIDYMSFFDTEIAKDRYVDLVFGDSDPDYNDLICGNEDGLFDDTNLTDITYEISGNANWAILDIAKAYEESDEVLDAILLEYTDFIELLIYIEEYKLDIANEFEDAMYEEISTDNDYSSRTVSQMESDIEDYIDYILEEDTSNFYNGELVDVIIYIFTEGFEDIEEAKELVEDCFDVDELVETMISIKGYTQS
ncbi:MAG: hypothetical protein R3Y32_06145 [Bacillota bacterium]